MGRKGAKGAIGLPQEKRDIFSTGSAIQRKDGSHFLKSKAGPQMNELVQSIAEIARAAGLHGRLKSNMPLR